MQKIAEKDSSSEDVREQLGEIGTAELVIGIPTLDNRGTVEHVAQAAAKALSRLSSVRSVMIHADGGSRDGTPEFFREIVGERVPLLQTRYPVYPVHRMSAPLAGVPGRREAATTIFQAALQLQAKACVLLDAEVASTSPEWVDRLAAPLLDGSADMVVPCYRRHSFDGMINTGIISPFDRALYGKRLRQPAGADLGFSSRLMELYAGPDAQDGLQPAVHDPWSTVLSIVHGFRITQTFLGPRSVQVREVPPELSETLRQVLTTLFEQMEFTATYWQKVRGSENVPWYGPPLEFDAQSSQAPTKSMVDSFRLGCQDLMGIWNLVLPPATLLDIRKLARKPDEQFRFPDELWARTIYDFALGYHFRVMGHDHLLKAITPLYLGWVGSFVSQTQTTDPEEVDSRFDQLSVDFETQKRYLISRWRSPDRFNP